MEQSGGDETGEDDGLKMGSDDQSVGEACTGGGGGGGGAAASGEGDEVDEVEDFDDCCPLPQKLCSERWLGVGRSPGCVATSTGRCCCGCEEEAGSRRAPSKRRLSVRPYDRGT